MTTITIRVVDKDPFGPDDDCTSTLEGNGTSEHWAKAIRGAMTLAGYQRETIDDVLGAPEAVVASDIASAIEIAAAARVLSEEQAMRLRILMDEVGVIIQRMKEYRIPSDAITCAHDRAKEAGL
jgi:hypothetical protein